MIVTANHFAGGYQKVRTRLLLTGNHFKTGSFRIEPKNAPGFWYDKIVIVPEKNVLIKTVACFVTAKTCVSMFEKNFGTQALDFSNPCLESQEPNFLT